MSSERINVIRQSDAEYERKKLRESRRTDVFPEIKDAHLKLVRGYINELIGEGIEPTYSELEEYFSRFLEPAVVKSVLQRLNRAQLSLQLPEADSPIV